MWLSRTHGCFEKDLLDNGDHVELPAMYVQTINWLLVGQLWHRDRPIVYTYATGSCEQYTTCFYIRIMCLCNLPLYSATYIWPPCDIHLCQSALQLTDTDVQLTLEQIIFPAKNFRVTTTFITYNHSNSYTFPSIVIYNFFICGTIAFSIWRHVYKLQMLQGRNIHKCTH